MRVGSGEEEEKYNDSLGNRCVLFCFKCSGPQFPYMLSEQMGLQDGWGLLILYLLGVCPSILALRNTKYREGQKDTASELPKDVVKQLRRGLQFQT